MAARTRGHATRRAATLLFLLLIFGTPVASAATCGPFAEACEKADAKLEELKTWWNGLSQDARDLLADPIGYITGKVSAFFAGLITWAWSAITGAVRSVGEWISNFILYGWSILGGTLERIGDQLKAWAYGAVTFPIRLFSGVSDVIPYEALGPAAPIVAGTIVFGIFAIMLWAAATLVTATKSFIVQRYTGGLLK